MPWRPGQRAAERALEAPYEDVPDHLRGPLKSWLDPYLNVSSNVKDLGIYLRVQLPPIEDNNSWSASHIHARALLDDAFHSDSTQLLDAVEFFLGRHPRHRSPELALTLSAANSVYTPNGQGDGLEMRVVPGVKDEVQAVVDAAAGSPGDHLATAWNEAYGRAADPVKAYSEAIKAVEAASAPIVSPSNLKATLGTIIRDVEAKPNKWKFEIDAGKADGVEVMLDMMRLLWGGQTSRHGGVNPTPPESEQQARAAVHLSATLVQWCVSGAFSVA